MPPHPPSSDCLCRVQGWTGDQQKPGRDRQTAQVVKDTGMDGARKGPKWPPGIEGLGRHRSHVRLDSWLLERCVGMAWSLGNMCHVCQARGAGILTLTLVSQEEQRSREPSPVLAPILTSPAGSVGKTPPTSSSRRRVKGFSTYPGKSDYQL